MAATANFKVFYFTQFLMDAFEQPRVRAKLFPERLDMPVNAAHDLVCVARRL
jgi:hypothetical protein